MMMKITPHQEVLRFSALLTLTVLTAGCTTTSSNTGTPIKCEQKSGADPGNCRLIQLTPLSRIWTGFRDPDENYSNFYTRVLINGATRGGSGSVKAGEEDVTLTYDYNDRGPWRRFFWGTHSSLNLSAYISLGTFQATVPLITIDHTSNRSDGEKFVRVVVHTAQNFPLVLLKGDGSNAIASARFVVKGTDTTQSSAAAAAIQVAQSIASTLAPESSVVTTLSSAAAKDKAAALDKAINSVLARQLDEEQWLDNDVRRWGSGVKVTFLIPPPNKETSWGDASSFRQVGTWTVRFETPRPSVFSDIQICLNPGSQDGTPDTAWCRDKPDKAISAAQDDAATRPEQVLNFNLLNGSQSLGTVAAYLKQQSWWDESMKTFNSMKDTEKAEPATAQFCRSIKQTIAGVGLNAIDAGIVTRAVGDRAILPSRIVTAMHSVPECQLAYPPKPEPVPAT